MKLRVTPSLEPVVVWTATMTAVVLLLSACSWSVPADPGLNAKLHGRPPTAEHASGSASSAMATVGQAPTADPGARQLYLDHCSRCHEPIPPGALAAQDWPRYVRRYGPRAGLFGTDRTRVLRWLQAHAR